MVATRKSKKPVKKKVGVKKRIRKAGAKSRVETTRKPVRKTAKKKATKKKTTTGKPKKSVRKATGKKAVKRTTTKRKKPAKRTAKTTRTAARKSKTPKKFGFSVFASSQPAQSKPIGSVKHYYRGIKVAVVKFSKPMPLGVHVHFHGATTNFKQKLDSMQHDHKSISKAPKGKQVGVKVKSRVRQGDNVHPV